MTRTVKEKCVELAQIGWAQRQIATYLGISRDTVHGSIDRARRDDSMTFPKPASYGQDGSITVKIEGELLMNCLHISRLTGVAPRTVVDRLLAEGLHDHRVAFAAIQKGDQ